MVISRQGAWIDAIEFPDDEYHVQNCFRVTMRPRWNRPSFAWTEFSHDIDYLFGPDQIRFTPKLAPRISALRKEQGTRPMSMTMVGVFDDAGVGSFQPQDFYANRFRNAQLELFAVDPRYPYLESPYLDMMWVKDASHDTRTWTLRFEGLTGRVRESRGDSYGVKCKRQLGIPSSGCTVAIHDQVNFPQYKAVNCTPTGINTQDRLNLLVTATGGALTAARWVEGWFAGGRLTGFLATSENRGIDLQVATSTQASAVGSQWQITIDLNEPIPFPVGVGDQFELIVGCDKTEFGHCGPKFGNRPEFRGQSFMEGNTSLTESEERS